MIRKTIFLFLILSVLAFSFFKFYKDGNYQGSSRAKYTDEPYYGFVNIAIEKGEITSVEFYIRDSAKHENFNDKYEKYFAGNEKYIRQCRDNWKGMQLYPDSLLKYQDISKVDAISGATWAYNIFKASAKEALSAAANESENEN